MAGRAGEEVKHVLYPALPGAPGHELWKRDFSGACSLFGVVFQPEFSDQVTRRAHSIDSLALFGIGASWGGFREPGRADDRLCSAAPPGAAEFGGPMIRLHIGLEEPADLIADLEQGLRAMRR